MQQAKWLHIFARSYINHMQVDGQFYTKQRWLMGLKENNYEQTQGVCWATQLIKKYVC